MTQINHLVHFEKDSKVLFYNPYTHRRLVLSPDEVDVRQHELDELREVDWHLMPFESLEKHMMRVEVTFACNLKCSYCLVFQNDVAQLDKGMTLETAKRLVEYYHEHLPGGILAVTGGEPLVNWKVCQYLFENVPLDVSKELYTNGLLLTMEIEDFLAEHHISVRFSIDGLQQHHIYRVDARGRSRYDLILQKYHESKQRGCQVGINCTVTNLNVYDLDEINAFFMEELDAKLIGYSIPHYAIQAPDVINDLDMDAYTERMLHIYEEAKRHHVAVNQILNKLAFIVRGRFKPFGCPALSPEVTFYPDGRQTICTKMDSHERTRHLTGHDIFIRLPIFQQGCQNCAAIGICGGGCYWDAVMRFGRMQDLRVCKFNRALLERMLWDVIEWEQQFGERFPKVLNELFSTSMF
jgi:uncharacterized protein